MVNSSMLQIHFPHLEIHLFLTIIKTAKINNYLLKYNAHLNIITV